MSEFPKTQKPIRVGIEGVFYSLAHVPQLVRYGSKPTRENAVNPSQYDRLTSRLRSFAAAVAYAPDQVFIGNLTRFSFFEIFINAGA